MADIYVENYKKAVAAAYDRWSKKLADCAKQLKPIDDELDKLHDNKKPSDDDKKKIKELEKKRDAIRQKAENSQLELKLDLMLLEVDPKADKKEVMKLPEWMKKIIKDKGVPLGDGVSVSPDVDFDFKAMKLKKFGLTFKWDI